MHALLDGRYPILHPVFRASLLGWVIGHIDYAMKGFINGGFYEMDFIRKFEQDYERDATAALRTDNLRHRVIDITEYCANHGISEYSSLNEMLASVTQQDLPLDGQTNGRVTSVKDMHMTNSFRIFAKQSEIRRQGGVFILSPDFDVEYTIEASPSEAGKLEAFKHMNGSFPEDYQRLEECYKMMAEMIKETMPKLPMFRPLFRMLSLVSFASYHVHTMLSVGRIPRSYLEPGANGADIAANNRATLKNCAADGPGSNKTVGSAFDGKGPIQHFPSVLPPIPIKRLKTFVVMIKFTEDVVLENICQTRPNDFERIFDQDVSKSCSEQLKANQRQHQLGPSPEESILQRSKRGLAERLYRAVRSKIPQEEVSDDLIKTRIIDPTRSDSRLTRLVLQILCETFLHLWGQGGLHDASNEIKKQAQRLLDTLSYSLSRLGGNDDLYGYNINPRNRFRTIDCYHRLDPQQRLIR